MFKFKNMLTAAILAISTLANADTILPAGSSLFSFGQPNSVQPNSIRSRESNYTLTMQTDGNLVLTGSISNPLWHSRTYNTGGMRATMQADGNFVVYDSNGSALWSTKTYGLRGAYLKLQNDGNLVVYAPKAFWASGTAVHTNSTDATFIMPGATFFANQRIYSKNNSYSLMLQSDGNLVLSNSNNSPRWSSKTAGRGAVKAVMQTDGNFVLYNANGGAVWHTRTYGRENGYLAIQDDGNLVVYAQAAFWDRISAAKESSGWFDRITVGVRCVFNSGSGIGDCGTYDF